MFQLSLVLPPALLLFAVAVFLVLLFRPRGPCWRDPLLWLLSLLLLTFLLLLMLPMCRASCLYILPAWTTCHVVDILVVDGLHFCQRSCYYNFYDFAGDPAVVVVSALLLE
jgi:hypothetical protein